MFSKYYFVVDSQMMLVLQQSLYVTTIKTKTTDQKSILSLSMICLFTVHVHLFRYSCTRYTLSWCTFYAKQIKIIKLIW